jgi:hypothetical protein
MVATDLRLSASSVYAAAREAGQTVMRPTGEVGTVAMTRFVPVERLEPTDPADLDDATFERVAHALADAISAEVAA